MSASSAESELASPAELWQIAATVEDPEMPPLTIADLGILRGVAWSDGTAVVTITPTYSGCPAVDAIQESIVEAFTEAGHPQVRVERTLSPAWTTDWITDEGRTKLAAVGIAPPPPPQSAALASAVSVTISRNAAGAGSAPVEIACPRCGSHRTEQVSRFGATACKALHRCLACAEPFDHFKPL